MHAGDHPFDTGGWPSAGHALRAVGDAVSPLPAPSLTVKPSGAPELSAPRATVGAPLGALTPDSSPREVAGAIIHEAQRGGYTPDQTTAILADAIQECNLSPRAVILNVLWVSTFQQDAFVGSAAWTILGLGFLMRRRIALTELFSATSGLVNPRGFISVTNARCESLGGQGLRCGVRTSSCSARSMALHA
jgi:hypothetical protein